MLSTEGIPIWIDCDTGHDDAIALLLASHLPYFNLLGVSTVYGNSSLRNTTRNTLSVLTAYNRTDIKVYSGSDKPLKKPVCFADSVHGESGLDGTDLLPEPAIEAISPDRAVFAMKKAIDMFPGKIAIVATGCLTNIARLVMEYPESLSKIGRLSIMGGGFEIGNITEWAEFNIWCDP